MNLFYFKSGGKNRKELLSGLDENNEHLQINILWNCLLRIANHEKIFEKPTISLPIDGEKLISLKKSNSSYKIHSLPVEIFKPYPNLKKINLNFNQLKELDVSLFNGLANLTELSLRFLFFFNLFF